MTENKDNLVRALGLTEATTMTVGTVIGVGLFTVGSAQVGAVGTWVILLTFVSLLISIWPALMYGEMSAMMPLAGGTYNYTKRGINRMWANVAGWNYIISVVAIGAGDALAFANYFKILVTDGFKIDISAVPEPVIGIILILVFAVLNMLGIEFSGKAQNGFVFFFWGTALLWFITMIPKINFSYFGATTASDLPNFPQMMFIFGLVWWCYTGFETCCSMGSETKFPQYNLPRALILSVFIVFAVNAFFQWFIVGLVPSEFYDIVLTSDAPYADGLKAAGFYGFPLILFCIGVAFGGDLSTINPGIAAPSRYIFTMAEDHAAPKFLAKVHPKYKTPYIAVLLVCVIDVLLIATNSLTFIGSVSLIALALIYMIGCVTCLALRKKYPDTKRPFHAPAAGLGTVVTIIAYVAIIVFADKIALLTCVIITVLAIVYWALYSNRHADELVSIEEEVGDLPEPTPEEKAKIDKEWNIWKIGTIVATIVALGIYVIPAILG